jgi:hypothetical protein
VFRAERRLALVLLWEGPWGRARPPQGPKRREIAIGLSLLLLPVLVAALVSLAAGGAKSAGIRVPRMMREGPWRS